MNLNITLLKDGKEKTYSQFFVSARYMRKALELRKDINLNNLSTEDVDTVTNFVVEVFENQFTFDDVYDGLEYDNIIPTIFNDVFMTILQGRKQVTATEDKDEEGNGKKRR
jgi:hypothetical protein